MLGRYHQRLWFCSAVSRGQSKFSNLPLRALICRWSLLYRAENDLLNFPLSWELSVAIWRVWSLNRALLCQLFPFIMQTSLLICDVTRNKLLDHDQDACRPQQRMYNHNSQLQLQKSHGWIFALLYSSVWFIDLLAATCFVYCYPSLEARRRCRGV